MKNKGLMTVFLIFLVFFSLQISSQAESSFSVRIVDFQSPVTLGEFMEFSYATKSASEDSSTSNINFWIQKDDEIITSGRDVVFLGSLEETTRTARVFLPSDFESGIYKLVIEVDYGNRQAQASRTIEIDVENGLAKINFGFGKTNIIIIFMLILLALLNVYLIYRLEKKKIQKLLREEEQFIKKHKTISTLTISFFLILGVLVYYLNRINFLPGIPLYFYYLILGFLLLGILLHLRPKKRKAK